jgi:hypothetical protein
MIKWLIDRKTGKIALLVVIKDKKGKIIYRHLEEEK